MPDLGSDLALAEPCLAARELSVSGWSLAERELAGNRPGTD